ncbi:MAG: 3-hydroxyacyl-CoA dehydrogenase NAD-binding domain-containing protein [Bordetella sp.]|uniref:3-hydroxyacyl-CoA dehydrogenase NAD-binding domain-containing protein n=1 Tax=Bordetella sp. TaxID=28081 RepID=UPI003F7BCD04
MNPNLSPSRHHWQLDTDTDGITWLTLDKAHESVNSLSKSVMAELASVLDDLDANPPKSLVIRSGKAAGFVAGADIGEFDELQSADAAKAMVERGWSLFNRLAAAPYPTLALVRGHCLGGGLELALACRTLLVVDEPGTRLGLPEVMLGIFPGWGGMLRLPQRVGPSAALDMMLTGKTVDAKRARRMDLADECVPPRVMESAARMLALNPPARRRLPAMQRLLGGPLKNLVAAQARKQVARRARPEHYPAPYAIIDLWARHGGDATAAPELTERIVASSTARNLVRVFRLQERLKSFGKNADAGEFSPRRVHVVGAGVMGGDIAAWCALRGLTVTLQDQDMTRIAPALQRAYALFDKRLRDPLLRRAAADRLIPDPGGQGARHADVVVEAIYENLEAKQALFQTLEALARPDAVLATNTSSLRLEDICSALKNPERLVGIHFFNPVAKMPLVEIVGGAGTDGIALARAAVFAGALDKLPLPVKSAPGFLVNAVLAPYMLEAMRCVDEGIAPETVDEAALAYGMPMGPIELIDTVGLDVALAAGKQLGGGAQTPRCLDQRIQCGDLGRKTGKGFYDYAGGKTAKGAAGTVPAGLAARLIAPLRDRTRALVEQGIVADADLADAGVIFGTGYAPFTGGPLFDARE